MIKRLLNLFKKQPQPKLTTDPISPFYNWKITKLKPYWEITWFDLLEYGEIRQIQDNTATIYYLSPSHTWKNLAGREALVKVCLDKKEIKEYILLEMN